MKQNLRRMLALTLAVIMAFALAACTPASGGPDAGSTAGGTGGKPFTSDTEISIVVGSHPSWPYEADWKYWQYFKEATGANLKVSAIAGTEFDTKVNLMLTSPDTLPDLLHLANKKAVDQHSGSGAFIAIDDHLDQMPNYSKFMDSLDSTVKNELLTQRVSGDGKVYFAPVYGSQATMNMRVWMYRKDIFEKNGLKAPTNLDELYTVCKKLKEIYPNSYPLTFRTGIGQLDIIGSTWKNDFSHGFYYDFQKNEWCYGAKEDTMLEMVKFFLKMSSEGLVPPDYLSINTGSWEELVSTERAFIMPEYLVRIPYFNIPNQKINPEYQWEAIAPPALNAQSDRHKIAKVNLDMTGYVVCNTGKQDRIGNAIKLLDWMYGDEASELLSWGKKGETYEEKDGKKQFILTGDQTPQLLYGAGTYGLYQRIDKDAFAQITATGVELPKDLDSWTEERANPTLYLSFNDEELAVYNEKSLALDTYVTEELSKFLLGQKPLSEWDKFVSDLDGLGVNELMEIYKSAWARTAGK